MTSNSVLKHFEILKDSDSDSGKCKAKCVHCSSIISANLKVTSNFVTHMKCGVTMKRKHRDIYITDNEKRVQEQPKMSEFMKKKVKYASTDQRQIQLTDALIKFIAGDLLPLSIVESEDFRNLMETADPKYQMPSRKYLSSKLLLENSTEVRNSIMHQLKLAENICLTVDIWSSRQMRGYLGITGHFILDWTLRSVLWKDKLNKIDYKVKLSSYERKLLQELCNILEPFEKATLLVQSENSASASLAIPVTCGLKHQICQISIDYSSKMISTLKHSIHSRLSVYENDDSFTIAAILDPRFKLRWCENEKIYAPVSLDDNPVSPPCKKVKQDDFFSFMPSTSTPSRQRHISGKSANTEVDEYLDEPCILMSENPILYWQNNTCRFPNLAKLACQVLCIPATSAPVERMFSVAGKTFRPDRCRLGDKTFENLMMIKCNAKNITLSKQSIILESLINPYLEYTVK
ncbi:hypothetical protein KUTeg_016120 [Tegillarca granosa]|uniref:HAT C-terminal dimerisation domain-containing protein n=1 Tax=Tegillarca granosa TaxID=220873 RepID=A0ABQ9EPS6_TEGGR|nr:hypothetical protein KUTeg_016120 [Tegillarca granosa]